MCAPITTQQVQKRKTAAEHTEKAHILSGGIAPLSLNPLTPNDNYSGRTARLTSKRCILYIYSTNIGTEYFKHCIYSPFLLFKI